MDPLSVGASAIAVATLAAQVSSAFARLRATCKTLPGRLHALNNEVTDIEVFCYQVAAVIDHRASSPIADTDGPHAHQTIGKPISAHDNNPRNKAFDFILQGFLSKEEVETLGCLTTGTDWVEDQNFTLIHKIVTGLCFQSLEEAILLYPDDIHAIDALGRTPLTWAAARGDEKAVVTLLSHGADPNTLDIQWTGPVSYAAERGHVICVRLLLEAGACPDSIIPGGLKIGSPLNCAARNSTNALVIKTLLDFGADVDATGVDGKTPLIHASRTNNASFATLLLEYGADVNAADITSHTPLTTAITHNSHNALQLLLNRWAEYSSCPRLQGPHLLETAAVFANLETLKILVATDHFRLKYDKNYVLADCATRIQDRYDVDEHIIAAFQDLTSVISDIPEMAESGLSRLEAGLLSYKDSPLIKNGLSERWGDDGSEESFEDAMGKLRSLNRLWLNKSHL